MNRREVLSQVTLLLGGTILGADLFLAGCKNMDANGVLFSNSDIALLDEVGETIFPETATSPGAREAKIGEFMKIIVSDCYNKKDQKIFTEGIIKLNAASKEKYNKDFIALQSGEKHDLFTGITKEMEAYDKTKTTEEGNHYFSMFRQLTVWGYFTSKPGATKALQYVPVPGRYEGCVPYKKGDKAWAT